VDTVTAEWHSPHQLTRHDAKVHSEPPRVCHQECVTKSVSPKVCHQKCVTKSVSPNLWAASRSRPAPVLLKLERSCAAWFLYPSCALAVRTQYTAELPTGIHLKCARRVRFATGALPTKHPPRGSLAT
jgi:hypothetical protein